MKLSSKIVFTWYSLKFWKTNSNIHRWLIDERYFLQILRLKQISYAIKIKCLITSSGIWREHLLPWKVLWGRVLVTNLLCGFCTQGFCIQIHTHRARSDFAVEKHNWTTWNILLLFARKLEQPQGMELKSGEEYFLHCWTQGASTCCKDLSDFTKM